MVRFILELEGHDVLEAHHGAIALERLRQERVELVITDVMMPVMDGNELIERLRADPERANLRIIVLSASPHNVDQADVVMRKPFAPADLRATVTGLLGSDAGG